MDRMSMLYRAGEWVNNYCSQGCTDCKWYRKDDNTCHIRVSDLKDIVARGADTGVKRGKGRKAGGKNSGNPKFCKTMNIRLGAEDMHLLDKIAAEKNISKSEVLRCLLADTESKD